MGLFKKKEPREIKDDDPTFIKLWYNPRTHALIVLLLYFLFFAFILIFVNVAGTRKKVDNSINGSTIKALFNNTSSKELSYNYVINHGSKTYYFSGNDKDEDIDGTILYNGESTTIKISDNKCSVGEYIKDEFVLNYKLCPENINYEYFDIENIYNLIKDVKGTKYLSDHYYYFKINNTIEVKIYFDTNDTISKISLSEKNYTYDLNLSYEEDITEPDTLNDEENN